MRRLTFPPPSGRPCGHQSSNVGRFQGISAPQVLRPHDQWRQYSLHVHYREAIRLLTLIAHEHHFPADLKFRSQLHENLSWFRTQHICQPEAARSSRFRSRTGHHAFPQPPLLSMHMLCQTRREIDTHEPAICNSLRQMGFGTPCFSKPSGAVRLDWGRSEQRVAHGGIAPAESGAVAALFHALCRLDSRGRAVCANNVAHAQRVAQWSHRSRLTRWVTIP